MVPAKIRVSPRHQVCVQPRALPCHKACCPIRIAESEGPWKSWDVAGNMTAALGAVRWYLASPFRCFVHVGRRLSDCRPADVFAQRTECLVVPRQ